MTRTYTDANESSGDGHGSGYAYSEDVTGIGSGSGFVHCGDGTGASISSSYAGDGSTSAPGSHPYSEVFGHRRGYGGGTINYA